MKIVLIKVKIFLLCLTCVSCDSFWLVKDVQTKQPKCERAQITQHGFLILFVCSGEIFRCGVFFFLLVGLGGVSVILGFGFLFCLVFLFLFF